MEVLSSSVNTAIGREESNKNAPLDENMKKRLVDSMVNRKLGNVVGAYEKHQEIRLLRIPKTGDTALHVALIDEWEMYAQKMISVAESNVLAIRNEQGDTPLHLAAKSGNAYLCQCIAQKNVNNVDLIGERNKDGETPLFSAALRGQTKAFLYLHHLSKDHQIDYTTRNNGDTILHSAISQEYFDLAYIIIKEYPKLMHLPNKKGLSPLHLLATKPSAFPSGVQVFGIRKLIYRCVRVQKLDKMKDLSKAPNPKPAKCDSYLPRQRKRGTFSTMLEDFLQLIDIGSDDDMTTGTILFMGLGFLFGLPFSIILLCIYCPCTLLKLTLVLAKNVIVDHWNNQQDEESNTQGHGEIDQQDEEADRSKKHDEEAANEQVDHWNNQQDEESNTQGHGEIDQQDEEADRSKKHDEEAANEQVDHRNNQQDEESANSQGCCKVLVAAFPLCEDLFLYPLFLSMCIVIFVCFCPYILLRITFKLAKNIIAYEEYARIKHTKEKCEWSVEVMNNLIESEHAYKQCDMQPKPPKEEGQSEEATIKIVEKLMFMAAKHGISEMVLRILFVNPEAIFEVNAEKKNIVMLAVEYRHHRLLNDLIKREIINRTTLEQVDKDRNTLLHIAANLEEGQQFWRNIRGAALHMHMEIKWYEFVKTEMPPYLIDCYNKHDKTPREIFKDSHRSLIKEARQWLTNTSQSCSVVAALIATVAFAASTTVPGGLKQDNGVPSLEHEPFFILSACSALLALSFSMISVVMFLGILTSSFELNDFRKDLPYKLLLGLVSLLISIVSMIVSFYAGHYFVLKQESNHNAALVYGLLCSFFPVFIISKFPLDYELVRTTLRSKPFK